MKSYQTDFIKPSIFDTESISSWFTKRGESVQDNFKIEGLLSKIKTTKSEYEQMKKLLTLIYLKKINFETNLFKSKTDTKTILSTLKKIIQ